MTNIRKILKQATALIIVTILCVSNPLQSLITEGNTITSAAQSVYLKEIRISTADSAEEAKRWLTNNGYLILDQDLNAGTGEDEYVYLGYKTTTDVSEAITDISMLNMNGGFKTINYYARA